MCDGDTWHNYLRSIKLRAIKHPYTVQDFIQSASSVEHIPVSTYLWSYTKYTIKYIVVCFLTWNFASQLTSGSVASELQQWGSIFAFLVIWILHPALDFVIQKLRAALTWDTCIAFWVTLVLAHDMTSHAKSCVLARPRVRCTCTHVLAYEGFWSCSSWPCFY